VDPEDQVIRHTDMDGTTVAWSSIGSGPPLIIGGWWSSHLDLDWEDPGFRRFVGRLAEHRSVIRYDRPGSGASDRRAALPADAEEEYAILAGVLDATGADSFALLGASSGCTVASAFAARQPDRTEALILYGGYVRGTDIAPPSAREAMLSIVEQHWGLGSRVLADVFLPGADDQERERFAVFQRRSASRDVAAASLRSAYSFDSSAHLADVHVPTLVLHRRDDRAIPFALGRDLADRIDGARFVPLDGVDHFPWRGDADAVAGEILRFLGHAVPERDAEPGPTSEVTLSEREREILALVARGHTDARIAEDLVLSTHTVHRHVANIRTKLAVPTRAAAAAWAKDHRVI
jgi:pimeloyl-ACP methyl ester carboxylesterase/DNA-binding CsgD family transcriptional regulator